ncbi:MAG: NusA-like transcription termination signal-binding factor, partial [archaeon]
PEDLGLAIGKNGSMINKVKRKLGKKIHVYKYSKDLEEFIRNLFYPVEPKEIHEKDGEVKIKVDPSDKKRTIGRKGKKVKKVKELTKRHFDIENIKII